MGVRGLTTYINKNEDIFLKDFVLYDSCVVIDGHSLCAQLYQRLNSFSAFGGDYDKFFQYVRTFFKHFRKCNLTSYVLFDGSYETRKLKTAYHRLRSKIYGASCLDPVTQGCMQIFPLLIRNVFKEALIDIGVAYTVCEFEADDEIAAMARHLNCPVLSYDSDFYIYNVLYIPFNTVDFKPKCVIIDGAKKHVLNCKIYRFEQLTNSFEGIKQEILPLLATLLGNDFVQKRVFGKFFSEFKLPKAKKNQNDQQRCIEGLFKWLQNESIDTAISKIIGRLKKNRKEKVFYIIKKSIEGYNRKNCRSLKYFNIPENTEEIVSVLPENVNELLGKDCNDNDDSVIPNNQIDENETIESPQYDSDTNEQSSEEENSSDQEDDTNELGIPDWFAEGIRNNTIPHSSINLYTHHLHFGSPQAEDYNDEDAFLCALPILRYSFDILTDYEQEYVTYVSRDKSLNYHRLIINREYSIPRPLEVPYSNLTDEQLRLYFLNFFKIKMPMLDFNLIDLLPKSFQLYMLSILWWVNTCEVPIGLVHSLFVCYIMLEMIDESIGTIRGQKYYNEKYQKTIEEYKNRMIVLPSLTEGELFLNKNKIQHEDCFIAAKMLLQYFEIDAKIKKRPKSNYHVNKIHKYAKFQCCLQQINDLNTLCKKPYQNTKYGKSYNGTFVYNFALKMDTQNDPKVFVNQYLKDSTTILMFYNSLCTVYDELVLALGLRHFKWERSKSRRKRKEMLEDELNFIVKGFESEVVI